MPEAILKVLVLAAMKLELADRVENVCLGEETISSPAARTRQARLTSRNTPE